MTPLRLMVLGAGGSAAENWIQSIRQAFPDAWILGVDTNPYLLQLSTADHREVIQTRPADGLEHRGELNMLLEDFEVDAIHAQPDEETLFLAENQWDLPTLDLPDPETVRLCQDKLACALALGDMAPESHRLDPMPYKFLAHWDNAGMNLDRPLWMRARHGAGSLAAKQVYGFGDLNAWREVWRGRVNTSDFMLSEYLPGRDLSYTSVWHNGARVAEAARERVQYANTRTPSGQSSSPSVARLHHDEDFYAFCRDAIRRVAEYPHGVFYVDCKEDADGCPKVTEINAGRFNTTQNMFTAAYCNLPAWHVSSSLYGLDRAHPKNPWAASAFTRPQGRGYWVRQPDMGCKMVPATVFEGVEV